MSDLLNVGTGTCQATASLLIKPVQAVVELGAVGDFINTALNTVHHANRHGLKEDQIAIALPEMNKGRKYMMPGTEIELLGSLTSLTTFLEMEGTRTLKRRGMLLEQEIEETFIEVGMVGAAYVRDRNCEKRTPGWIRRSKARAERRSKPLGKNVIVRSNDLSALAVKYGKIVLHIREQVGKVTSGPLIVSTYGFSSPANPAILPVMPESVRNTSNAE